MLRLVAGASSRHERRPAARILLIAYKFPPYARRRRVSVGASSSKYLARLGHEIHVVSGALARAYGPNTLMADAAEPGVIVHADSAQAPRTACGTRPLRGRWRVGARYVALRGARRSVLFYDDEAQRWGRHLMGVCERLIDERGIEVAVATGHPFQANRWAARAEAPPAWS